MEKEEESADSSQAATNANNPVVPPRIREAVKLTILLLQKTYIHAIQRRQSTTIVDEAGARKQELKTRRTAALIVATLPSGRPDGLAGNDRRTQKQSSKSQQRHIWPLRSPTMYCAARRSPPNRCIDLQCFALQHLHLA